MYYFKKYFQQNKLAYRTNGNESKHLLLKNKISLLEISNKLFLSTALKFEAN